MKTLRIGIDVDGVLADFNRAFIDYIPRVTGRDLFPTGYVPTTWNYPEALGYTGAEVSKVWEGIKADDSFWRFLPAYPDTVRMLSFLAATTHDIYFITNRPGRTAKTQTERWLQIHGFDRPPTVLISSHKGDCAFALLLDLYLDDRDENCLEVFEESDTNGYMLAQPWNTKYPRIPRLDALTDFIGIIRDAEAS